MHTRWNKIIGQKKWAIGCWVQVCWPRHKAIVKSAMSKREVDGGRTLDWEDVVVLVL